MKRFIALLLAAMMILSLAACGEKTPETKAPETKAPETKDSGTKAPETQAPDVKKETPDNIVIATGNASGTFYFIGAAQAAILDQEIKDITYAVEATTGTKENLVYCQDDAGTIAMSPLDYAYAAYVGDKSMGFESAMPDLRLIMTGHSTSVHFVVLKDSPIQSFADIKGKKVGLPVNTSGYYVALRLFAEYGITENDITIVPASTSEAGDALKDGTIDIAVYSAGAPISSVVDLAMSKDIRLLSLDDEKIADAFFGKYGYYYKSTIAGGTYNNVADDCTCINFPICLVVNNKLDDEIVYNAVKVLNENTEALGKTHKLGVHWNTENTLKFFTDPVIPFATGAEKYYNEKK